MSRSVFSKKIRQFKFLSRKIVKNSFTSKILKRFRNLAKELGYMFGRPQLLRWVGAAALSLATTIGSAQIAFDSSALSNPYNLQQLSNINNLTGPCSIDFVDIDNDGDLDIYAGTSFNLGGGAYVPRLWFIENTGTPTQPYFANPQIPSAASGLSPLIIGGYAVSPHFTDLDQDGDYDLMLTSWYTYGNISYFQNTGTGSSPSFSAPQVNPYGMNISLTAGAFAKITTADIDADGDLDLFGGNLYAGGNTLYYQLDTSTSNTPTFGSTMNGPFGFSTPSAFHNAQEFVDIDKDGDLDIFSQARYGSLGTYFNGLRFNPNQGTAQSPVFGQSQQLNAFGIQQQHGYLNAPAFGDLDNDGDEDLMFIDFAGNFYYHENLSTYPIFEFDSSSFHTTENLGTLAFTLWQRQPSNVGAVSIQVFDSGLGTATSGIDYILNMATTFNFPLGFSYQTVNVQILDDGLLEGQETIILQLNTPSPGTSLGTKHTATIYINDDETTGIEGLEHEISIKVFPNPVVNQLQIKFSERGQHLIKLFDMNGRQQISQSFEISNTTIDLEHLPSGFYQLEIYNKKSQPVHQQFILKD